MSKSSNYLLIILAVIVIFEVIAIFLNKPGSNSVNQLASRCQSTLNNLPKQKCWEELLESTLKEKGVEDAFLVFDNLYKTEPQFASDCHGYTHTLGAATYQLLIKGKEFYFPPQTAYCGYGFYHGLTELLLQTSGPKGAAKLCDSKKSQITQVLYDACYHGIGHGALSQTARNADAWGNPQKMIDLALNTCIDATSDPIQRSRCASGVFMELGNNYIEGKLQLVSIKDDPLLICRQQQDFGKLDCYTQMYGVLSQVSEGNLSKAAKFIETIPEDKYAVDSMIDLGGAMVNIHGEQNGNISICRNLQARLHLPCIQGIVLAFLLKGQPGIEYERAINFCNSSILSGQEKQSCFNLLLRHSKQGYTVDKVNTICSKVDSRYKKDYCLNN
jgi:hypothetical protein